MNLTLRKLTRLILVSALTSGTGAFSHAAESVSWWLTSMDAADRLTQQSVPLVFAAQADSAFPSIVVDPTQRFQSIDGFGFALTGGSAQHLIAMSAARRAVILQELFSTQGSGIGISYLRLSIGASDLNERVFSYDDLPGGQTDPKLEHFNLSEDRTNVIPVLNEILAINPKIKILASPWSAPVWMKTNHKVQGGKLKPECYPVYAQYFVQYIQAMAAEGITIDALTVQNEPFNDGNTPSMQMFPKDQALFIKENLGPAFRAAGIQAKIVLYDHNCDAPEYPISILTDSEARPYIDGSGFHLYAGPITALSVVHDRFPDKNIYFTEMMAVNRNEFNVAGPVARIVVGATRNWSRNVILWNLAADSKFRPHTDNGGCSMCQGAMTIDGDNVERNLAYYVIAHASKFVPDGSVRIGSTDSKELPNVAFSTPTGKTAVVVANPGNMPQKFNLVAEGKSVLPELPPGAVATFVW
ncbi:MAG: glycoside hydrolase family 30 protein [Limisphaerales bacterium]